MHEFQIIALDYLINSKHSVKLNVDRNENDRYSFMKRKTFVDSSVMKYKH